MADERRGSLSLFIIDAFTSKPFSGNPAAVCLVGSKQLSDQMLQKIAQEMNLSDTGFILEKNSQDTYSQGTCFGLRWFTPTCEVPLCGHATLASAAVLFNCLGNPNKEVTFETLSGNLKARKEGSSICLDFPLNPCEPWPLSGEDPSITKLIRADWNQLPKICQRGWKERFEITNIAVFQSGLFLLETNGDIAPQTGGIFTDVGAHTNRDFVEVVEGSIEEILKFDQLCKSYGGVLCRGTVYYAAQVVGDLAVKEVEYNKTTKNLLLCLQPSLTRKDLESFCPDFQAMTSAHSAGIVRGVIVTLQGTESNGCVDTTGEVYDFISRYFAPWRGVPEDPVTGSAHTVLASYWSTRLKKTDLYARQCSSRGGELTIHVREDNRVDITGQAVLVLQGSLYV